jgi:5-oxoprolinase (ATP-hydrolysing)
MQCRFEAAYRKRFAFLMPGKPLVVEAVSAEAHGPASAGRTPMAEAGTPRGPLPSEQPCACSRRRGVA